MFWMRADFQIEEDCQIAEVILSAPSRAECLALAAEYVRTILRDCRGHGAQGIVRNILRAERAGYEVYAGRSPHSVRDDGYVGRIWRFWSDGGDDGLFIGTANGKHLADLCWVPEDYDWDDLADRIVEHG